VKHVPEVMIRMLKVLGVLKDRPKISDKISLIKVVIVPDDGGESSFNR
jgi:hypothetical protein